MKHHFVFILCICIITLTACSVKQEPTLLCISDEYTTAQSPTFVLTADIPDDAILLNDLDHDSTFYEQGDYQIICETFSSNSVEEGLKKVTGKDFDSLHVVHLHSFPQEEYRFSWSAVGESGDLTCCGTMFFDGSTCYALSFQCPSSLENHYRSTFYHILSNAELQSV